MTVRIDNRKRKKLKKVAVESNFKLMTNHIVVTIDQYFFSIHKGHR